MEEVKIFVTNIEEDTLENKHYRRVLFTTPDMQLVVMKLYPGEKIPTETHRGTQFVRIEKGTALVKVEGEEFNLTEDKIVMIPANTKHYFERKKILLVNQQIRSPKTAQS